MRLDSPRPSPNSVRLQKVLAASGFGSRRTCETLIAAGRVTVNGRRVGEQGVRVDPGRDRVCVDDHEVRREKKIYILFNKPADVLCTCQDPRGRRTFLDYVKIPDVRLYSVGRLDRDTEGLLILTNDGELTQHLAHPRYEVRKTYQAWVAAPLAPAALQCLRAGVESEGERLALDEIAPLPSEDGQVRYEIVLHAGRNRHIRRMFEALGIELLRLKRIGIGPLRLHGLRVGQWRSMTDKETSLLRQFAAHGMRGAR